MGRWLALLFAVTQFRVPDFVSNQERLVERRPFGLVDDERNVRVKGGPPAIEQRTTRSAGFDVDPEVFGYANSELIRGPRIAPALDGFIV